jgi:hypothetical protein
MQVFEDHGVHATQINPVEHELYGLAGVNLYDVRFKTVVNRDGDALGLGDWLKMLAGEGRSECAREEPCGRETTNCI